MGACFNTSALDGKLTKSELVQSYENLVEDQRYEHGNGGYSGTFATLCGIKVLDRTFNSENEASEYIADNSEKRGPALAVKYKDLRPVFKKKPTFGGKEQDTLSLDPEDLFRHFGQKKSKCIASEVVPGTFQSRIVLADQLTDTQKKTLKEAVDPLLEENRTLDALLKRLKELVAKAGNVDEDFGPEDHKSLKEVRRQASKCKGRRLKLLAKLDALDQRFGSKLWEDGQEDHGTKWLVGGWCAE